MGYTCDNRESSGSCRIRTRSSSDKGCRGTILGILPINSGLDQTANGNEVT
jgi:hypothetical protein